MTLPRMCVPGATYLVTRTVTQRLFLLTPSPIVNQVFAYCLARAAQMFGVLIHAACVESTHFHLVVTDTRGNLSDFMHWLDRHVARCLIEHYAQTHPQRQLDGLWSKSPFGATLLVNHEAILDKIVYTLTNPQKDGLVADYRDWPGFHTRPSHWLDTPRIITRPDLYFSARSPEHTEVELVISPPPAFAGCDVPALARDVEALIRDRQEAVRAGMRAAGRSFLGVKAILRADPFDSPRTPRPKGGTNPAVAAGGNGDHLRTAIKAVREFRRQYRAAWELFRTDVGVMFPGGTLRWTRLLGAACEKLDTPWCLRCAAT